MIKVYKKLTDEQKQRNIIFSSTLSVEKTEQPSDRTHEIKDGEDLKGKKRRLLLDDSFFNVSHYNYNIIRQ